MILCELVLENFGSYLGRNTIDLLPDLSEENRPIVLIGGMNGGGKTTIMDAIRLALYGSRAQCSTRGNLSYGEFLTQCVHRQMPPTQRAGVELTFQVPEEGELVTIKIVRIWERTPKDGKDILGVYINEWKDETLVKTWDEYIESILPLGISNLFLFDGERVKELAEQETPPPIVFEAIQSLLGLELAERLSADLDVLASRKLRDVANAEQLETIDKIEAKLAVQQAEASETQIGLERLAEKLAIAQDIQSQAIDRFAIEGGKIAAQRKELEMEGQHLRDRIDLQRQELATLATGNLPLALIAPILDAVWERGQIELHRQQGKAALDLLVDRDRRLLAYLQNRDLSAESVSDIRLFLERENRELSDRVEAGDDEDFDVDVKVMEQLDRLLNVELDRDVRDAKEITSKLSELEAELDTLDRQIATAASPEEYNRLRASEKETRELVTKLTTEQIESTRRAQELDRAIAKTKQELATYTEQNIKLTNDRHIVESIAKVKSTLQIFKDKLTLKKIDKLETEVTECFRYLLHKSELVSRVTIDSETFILSLYDREGKLLPKHRLSAGEKQLLAIAFLWGLARISGRQLPIAIDTPLGRLDSSHRTNLIERYFPTASPQVILLSTDTEIATSEVANLRTQGSIAREYILEHDPIAQRTTVKAGYFWE